MAEILKQLWEMAYPILAVSIMGFLATLLPIVSNAVRSSQWYKDLPWWHRKLIDFFGVVVLKKFFPSAVLNKDIAIALEEPVKELMPTAKDMRGNSGFGKIEAPDAATLTAAAVEAAMDEVRQKHPELSTWTLQPKITEAVPAVVEKVKAAEEKDRTKTGGHSPGGTRPL